MARDYFIHLVPNEQRSTERMVVQNWQGGVRQVQVRGGDDRDTRRGRVSRTGQVETTQGGVEGVERSPRGRAVSKKEEEEEDLLGAFFYRIYEFLFSFSNSFIALLFPLLFLLFHLLFPLLLLLYLLSCLLRLLSHLLLSHLLSLLLLLLLFIRLLYLLLLRWLELVSAHIV